MKIHRWAAPIAVGVLLCACAGSALRATTLMRMTLAQMAHAAQAIVRARCVANTTQWDNGELWTLTSFDVEETWRGAAGGQITVRLLGGRTSQFTSTVSGVPHFRPGEDVVLFLERDSRGDYSVMSWQQGTFRVQRDGDAGEERVTQDSASLETYDPLARRFATSGIRSLPIGEFRLRVESALAKGKDDAH